MAAKVVCYGGAVISAVLGSYRATRNDARNLAGSGRYFEVFGDTHLEVCEDRDRKGMYTKARLGEIKGFAGIDNPYEPPRKPEF